MRSRDTLRAVAVAAITVAGCRVVSSRADYAAYRNFRYAAEGSDRLAAASEYLQAQPNGRFRPEVQSVINATEEDYWADHRASLDGLNEYLRSFPAGTHVEEARQRLAVYERTRAESEAARRAAEAADGARREAELAATAARARLWGRTSFNRWIRLFGGLNAWGRGVGEIVQGNPEFGAAFENAPPQCRASHCRKDYAQDFFIPVPGRSALPRRATLSLDMVRVGTERNVNQVFTVMRNRGLTQWWELENQSAADPADPQAREAAVRWTMEQLRAIVAASFPEARETPAELYGPPPEAMGMEGEEDENAAPVAVDPNACIVPSQPLGTRWSAVIGCTGITARPFTAPAEAAQAHAQAMAADEPAVTPHACLRIDAYAALDGEGMPTDEGVALSLIPACATTAAPGRPGARPRVPSGCEGT
ncbi:MAG: hypothetical protein Q8S73_43755, partial [Deltaproteobacteria bacterium]|nr:hypothetical protein [Deltaproteobacteria bacterium]